MRTPEYTLALATAKKKISEAKRRLREAEKKAVKAEDGIVEAAHEQQEAEEELERLKKRWAEEQEEWELVKREERDSRRESKKESRKEMKRQEKSKSLERDRSDERRNVSFNFDDVPGAKRFSGPLKKRVTKRSRTRFIEIDFEAIGATIEDIVIDACEGNILRFDFCKGFTYCMSIPKGTDTDDMRFIIDEGMLTFYAPLKGKIADGEAWEAAEEKWFSVSLNR